MGDSLRELGAPLDPVGGEHPGQLARDVPADIGGGAVAAQRTVQA